MAADLVKGMSAGDISKLFATAADTQAKAGFLKMLATSGVKAGLDPAKQAMKHESPAVRAAAVGAFSAIGGAAVTEDILKFLLSAGSLEECHACEDALLSRIGDAAAAVRIRDSLIAMKSGASSMLLESVYYLIARSGWTLPMRCSSSPSNPASSNCSEPSMKPAHCAR